MSMGANFAGRHLTKQKSNLPFCPTVCQIPSRTNLMIKAAFLLVGCARETGCQNRVWNECGARLHRRHNPELEKFTRRQQPHGTNTHLSSAKHFAFARCHLHFQHYYHMPHGIPRATHSRFLPSFAKKFFLFIFIYFIQLHGEWMPWWVGRSQNFHF